MRSPNTTTTTFIPLIQTEIANPLANVCYGLLKFIRKPLNPQPVRPQGWPQGDSSQTTPPSKYGNFWGGGGGTTLSMGQTSDFQFTIPTLYQLSYRGCPLQYKDGYFCLSFCLLLFFYDRGLKLRNFQYIILTEFPMEKQQSRWTQDSNSITAINFEQSEIHTGERKPIDGYITQCSKYTCI